MGYAFIGMHVVSALLIIVYGNRSASTQAINRIDTIKALRKEVKLLNQIRDVKDLKKVDIVEHLMRSGARDEHFRKPSTAFMMTVFESLLDGENLPVATGHTDRRTRHRLRLADTVRSFSAQREGREYIIHIPALPENEKASFVELRLQNRQHLHKRQKIRIHTYDRDRQKLLQKFTCAFDASKGRGNYIADITKKTLLQINNFRGNITLTLTLDTQDQHGSTDELETAKPILVLYSQDKQFMEEFYNSYIIDSEQETNRHKRDLVERDTSRKGRKRHRNRWRKNRNKDGICQLYDLKVDFDLIGWGPWIIHPKTFNSKVCYGRCPGPIANEFTPTNHAMLQALMRMKRPLAAPEPCCVPTKLRPLSMLYFEYDDIVVRHHVDMVAASCGCR